MKDRAIQSLQVALIELCAAEQTKGDLDTLDIMVSVAAFLADVIVTGYKYDNDKCRDMHLKITNYMRDRMLDDIILHEAAQLGATKHA